MHASLEKILSTPSNQIDRVAKPLPQGWYSATVDGQPEEGESSQKGTPFLAFNMRILDAYKDVNEDELERFLTNMDGSTRGLNEVYVTNTYYMPISSPNPVGRLLQFLDHLEGLKPSDVAKEKISIKQRIAGSNGRSCLIHIKHEPWQSGEGVSSRVDQTMIYDE